MIRVTCGIIKNEEEKILVVQRGPESDHPMKWEFPGGKVNPGESDEDSVIREIGEELSMEIVITGRMQPVVYDYGFREIELIPFICDTLDEIPFLNEHVAYLWLSAEAFKDVDFAQADRLVAENYINNYYSPTTASESISDAGSYDKAGSADPELMDMIGRMISLKEVDWIATSALDNPLIIRKLLDYSLSTDKKLAFHSSWILTKAFDKKPDSFNACLPEITDAIERLDNESVLRSFLRIISLSDLAVLNQNYHGMLTETCFTYLRSRSSAIAVKAYSMEILYRIAMIYPELINELASTIRLMEADDSAGIKARGSSILKKLANFTNSGTSA